MANSDDCVYWLKKIYGRLALIDEKMQKENNNSSSIVSLIREFLKLFKG